MWSACESRRAQKTRVMVKHSRRFRTRRESANRAPQRRESGIPQRIRHAAYMYIATGQTSRTIALIRKGDVLINVAQFRLPTQQLGVTARIEQGATNVM